MRNYIMLFVAVLGFLPLTVNAGIIFSQTPEISTGTISDADSPRGFRVADDFTLDKKSTITGVTWRGLYYADGTAPSSDNFFLNFYKDVGGAVGNTLSSYNVGDAVDRADTGQDVLGCCDVFEYSATLESELFLSGGTYWLSIVNVTFMDANDDWLWGTQPIGGNNQLSSNSGVSWNRNNRISYFEINGHDTPVANVSEPGSYVLLLLGLLGLCMKRCVRS